MPPSTILQEVDTSFLTDVLQGLSETQKLIPSKYFYDESGSKLFDDITDLREYYPTRTEEAIMFEYIDDIVASVGAGIRLVELGSGSSRKTRILLDKLSDLCAYVPVDISETHLNNTATLLGQAYPGLLIEPVAADYTSAFELPAVSAGCERSVAYFPGSTVGNFHPDEAIQFLGQLRSMTGVNGGLLIGVDLVKDRAILEAAYNDDRGVTAAFNLNLLHRINAELDADFDTESFQHRAVFNTEASRIEMHLVSKKDQVVRIAGNNFVFSEGEYIYTESSYKYTIQSFTDLAGAAGYKPVKFWTDRRDLFSIHYLEVST